MKPVRHAVDLGLPTTLPANLAYEEWAALGHKLGRWVRGIQWVIAAWILYGESHYGERYAQAVAETGLAPQTILNILSVARAFPPSRQREALSFSHHDAVAPLEATEQDKWLNAAEKGAWSVTRLRAEVRASGVRRAVALPTPAEPPAPESLVPGVIVSIHGIGRCTITAILAQEHGLLPAPGTDVLTDVLIYCNRTPEATP